MPTEKNGYSFEPEKWIENYGDLLFSFAFNRVHRQEVAEDLVQDTLLSAYKARESFLFNSSEKTWLLSILKRKIIDHYRKKSTQNELTVFDKETDDDFMNHFFEKGGNGHWTEKSMPKTGKNDFETGVDSEEFSRILQNCLGKLPGKLSAVFTLKNMDELETEEICKELQITPSNYWVMMHRAKLQLRECMQKNWLQT